MPLRHPTQQVNRNNPTHTAGTTFVGQFLDHDITFDATSPLGVPTEPETTRNTRVPSLDLDSVYGGGPSVSPQLYQSEDRAKLLIESGGLFEDVPRNPDGAAIIADARNDENLVISGLQAAFIIFHNTMVDLVRQQRAVEPQRRQRHLQHGPQPDPVALPDHDPHPVPVACCRQGLVDDVMANGQRHSGAHTRPAQVVTRPARAWISH